jgi:hypothetical protein
VLEEAEEEHGEWLLGQPALGLQLLVELQELDPAGMVLAWPEGETMRVSKRIDSGQMRLNIKSDKDWFAASGELQIDEDKVMDLRALLELMQNSQSRFVEPSAEPLLALTDALYRRLQQAGLWRTAGRWRAPASAGRVRAGRTGHDVGTLKSDKLWKQHLARMQAQEAFTPELPHPAGGAARLSARRLQLAGAPGALGRGRLSGRRHGLGQNAAGAGADPVARAARADTGGRTYLGLHELDQRSGAAPTLNMQLFGSGDRAAMLGNLQPYDVVVTSYGLLQLEAACSPACSGTPSCSMKRRPSRTAPPSARRP